MGCRAMKSAPPKCTVDSDCATLTDSAGTGAGGQSGLSEWGKTGQHGLVEERITPARRAGTRNATCPTLHWGRTGPSSGCEG